MSGHAVAGGLLLALATDKRVMRSDRGFCVMNEIDMAVIAGPGAKTNVKPGMFPGADAKMVAVLRAKLPTHVCREVLLGGKRYSGQEAAQLGLVDESVAGEEVLTRALAVARELAKRGVDHNRRTVRTLKSELVSSEVAVLLGKSRL
eukprot:Hpha_TRINITY_DN31093_c0_g1::TRINITY_DN31093_c0_g1_i1::g.64078::m.64078